MDEQWKWIAGYEGIYEVSTEGRVRSNNYSPKKILSTYIDACSGKVCVGLVVDARTSCVFVDGLVARAFVPNPNRYLELEHIDGDKANSRADNLRWVPCGFNVRKRRENGIKSTNGNRYKHGSDVANSVLGMAISGMSIRGIAATARINRRTVKRILMRSKVSG